MILFKQQRNDSPLKAVAPSRSLAEVSESGFIISEFFVKWLNHFANHAKQTTEKKALHFSTGHITHSNNLEV
jgi:hypothetical protein